MLYEKVMALLRWADPAYPCKCWDAFSSSPNSGEDSSIMTTMIPMNMNIGSYSAVRRGLPVLASVASFVSDPLLVDCGHGVCEFVLRTTKIMIF